MAIVSLMLSIEGLEGAKASLARMRIPAELEGHDGWMGSWKVASSKECGDINKNSARDAHPHIFPQNRCHLGMQ